MANGMNAPRNTVGGRRRDRRNRKNKSVGGKNRKDRRNKTHGGKRRN
jgi:hypothetical protein